MSAINYELKNYYDNGYRDGYNAGFSRAARTQLTLEELRAQFEAINPEMDYRFMLDVLMYFNKAVENRWQAYQECAKANNIMREG